MHYLHSYIALEIARDRTREAERLHRLLRPVDGEAEPGVVRRSLARFAAGVSLGAAAVGRRLDACTFDAALIDTTGAPGYRSAR